MLKLLIRKIPQIKLRKTLTGPISLAQFSSQARKGQAKLTKLKTAIDSERAFEESQLLDYTTTFPFFQKHGWEVADQPKDTQITLTKSYDGHLKAVFKFEACGPKPKETQMSEIANNILNLRNKMRSQNTDDNEEESPEAQKAVKQLQSTIDAEPPFEQNAELLITFGGSGALHVYLNLAGPKVEIRALSVLNTKSEKPSNDASAQHQGTASNTIMFPFVESDVQKSIEEFLQSLGIDATFAVRVQQLSIAKDQKLYYDFLSQFSELLEVRK